MDGRIAELRSMNLAGLVRVMSHYDAECCTVDEEYREYILALIQEIAKRMEERVCDK